jgi:lysophospholipase L1-like esterase
MVARDSGASFEIEPACRLGEPEWSARWAAKRAEPRDARVTLVFLGDSITQNYELDGPELWARFAGIWRLLYAPRGALNLGYAGDATDNLLWRIRNGELDGLSPRVVVLLIGINDVVVHGRPAATVVAGIDTILAELAARLPASRVLLLGLLPHRFSDASEAQALAVNAALAAREWGGGPVTYLDAGDALMRGDELDEGSFCDILFDPGTTALVHPSACGQARLAALVEPALAALLASSG